MNDPPSIAHIAANSQGLRIWCTEHGCGHHVTLTWDEVAKALPREHWDRPFPSLADVLRCSKCRSVLPPQIQPAWPAPKLGAGVDG